MGAYFRNQLGELLTNYGDIFEVWFDGANGGDGWYGGANETRKIDRTTYYQWPETYQMIRELQPNCLIWNDGSDRGDLRWVGTEAGNVGETNLIYLAGFAIWLWSWQALIVWILFFAIMFIQVLSEERRLHHDFGNEYDDYCRHTRRF